MKAQKVFERYQSFDNGSARGHLQIGMMNQIERFVKQNASQEKDPLWVCSKFGKTLFVDFLLKAGYNVHKNDDAPLRWAAGFGHSDVVKILMDWGANIQAKGGEAFDWASRNKHYDIIQILRTYNPTPPSKEENISRAKTVIPAEQNIF